MSILKKCHAYLRVKDWADSKVPFMGGALLFAVLFENQQRESRYVYLAFAAYILYVSMFLAFSYVINDYCDMDVDKRAGKQKVMFTLPRYAILLSMFLMVAAGTVPMFLLVSDKWIYIGFTTVLYLFGAAYSVRGLLRFKERGIIGLLECSFAQRCMPLIPIIWLFRIPVLYLALFLIVSFVNGLRYILIHQVIDLENDRKTGVKTYLSEGKHRYRIAIVILLVTEIIIMSGIMGRIIYSYPPVAAFVVFYLFFERIIGIVVTCYMQVDLLNSFLAVPLEALYNVFFPLLMALLLTAIDYVYAGIPMFLFIITFNCLKGKAAFIKTYIQSIKKTGRD